MIDFVHLHVHTHYSILDGQSKVNHLVDKAVADGMKGMAITDHGVMYGIKEFADYCAGINKQRKKEGKEPFKPIFGCEMYVANDHKESKDKSKGDNKRYHLIVLAKNYHGYKNLIKLVSNAWVDGFYTRPRTDRYDLEKYHEDLIVCSACIAGEVPSKILEGDIDGAREAVQWYHRVFGDDYYLELQRHEVKDPNIVANRETFPLQQKANKVLIELAREYGVKLVCSNDCHFEDKDTAEAHDHLLCISTGKDLDDPNRLRYTKQEWFKTQQEMNDIFSDIPEALSNTCEILDKVEIYSIDHGPIMPFFPIPESFGTEEEWRTKFSEEDLYKEFTTDENGEHPLSPEEGQKVIDRLGGYDKIYRIKFEADYLAKLAYEGARRLYGDPIPDNVAEHVKFELHVMKTMGFPGYFLIVQDFINSARNDLGVWVGPGRGSAAGSVVAYCLGITKIDPLKYDLLFERFLNPERVSMPDIDVDFCFERRQEVIDYVRRKYGDDCVVQIVTFGTLAARGVIRDVGRVMDLPYAQVDTIAKMIPQELNITIDKALQMNPEFKKVYEEDKEIHELIDTAKRLEGLPRHTSMHAAGVVISQKDVSEYVPLSRASDGSIVTQFTMTTLEELGLLKMDFLGLRTLTVIQNAVHLVEQDTGVKLDMQHIDYNDKKVLDSLGTGHSDGVFQLESAGMKNFMKELKPQSLEDVIAGISLYRPGPMDFIPQYIRGKNRPDTIKYDCPQLEPILKPTYGCIVYQEQVMQIVRNLAGYTLGRSDLVRRAMSKKKAAVMEKERQNFVYGNEAEGVPGCIANGIPEQTANKIYDDMIDFAKYAFNKSHAAAYAVVSYQTAFLKYYYPVEFMAALMTSVIEMPIKVAEYIQVCRKMNIKILPPDVNRGAYGFSVDNGAIRYGLSAIKSVGRPVIDALVEEREANGEYRSLKDFIERLTGTVNKRAIENFIKAGALDCLEGNRRQKMVVYSQIVDSIAQEKKNSFAGQMSLFDLVGEEDKKDYEIRMPDVEEYDKDMILGFEKDVLGIYLSGHPLEKYRNIMEKMISARTIDFQPDDETGIPKVYDGQKVIIGGMITEKTIKYTRNNKVMAFLTVEDLMGTVEIVVFPRDYEKWQTLINEDARVFIQGRVNAEDDKPSKLILEKVRAFDDIPREIWIQFKDREDYAQKEQELLNYLRGSVGTSAVVIYLKDVKAIKRLPAGYHVQISDFLLEELKKKYGDSNVKVVERVLKNF